MVQERIISTEIDLKHQMPESDVNKYITEITDTGISIHPKEWTTDSHYLQLSGEGTFIKESTGIELSKFTGNNIQIGQDNEWKVNVNKDGIYILDPNNRPINQMTAKGNVIGYEDAERMEITPDGLSAFNADSVKFFDVDYDGGVYTNRIYYEKLPHMTEYYDVPRDEVTTLLNMSSHSPEFIYKEMGKNFTPVISGELDIHDRFQGTDIKNWRDTINMDVVASEEEGVVHFETQDVPISYGTETIYSFTADVTTMYSDILHTFHYQIKVYFSDDLWYVKTTIEINQVYEPYHTISSYEVRQVIDTVLYRDITTHAPALTFGVGSGSTNGNFSSKFGEFLATVYSNQTAIGKYNNNQQDNIFEIGNGTDDNNRSNALAVDWNGNIRCAGGIYATPTEISLTFSQCTNGSYTRCYKVGNMVFFSWNINITTATVNYDYIRGLPIPLGGGWGCSATPTGSVNTTRWWVTPNGTLRTDGATVTGWQNGSVSYICQ